jgi:hypothetical protein
MNMTIQHGQIFRAYHSSIFHYDFLERDMSEQCGGHDTRSFEWMDEASGDHAITSPTSILLSLLHSVVRVYGCSHISDTLLDCRMLE